MFRIVAMKYMLLLLLSMGIFNFASSQQFPSSTTHANLGVQVTLDLKALRGELMEAALEKKTSRITLPLQNGESMEFEVIESPVMEQGLADQFPEIRSFLVQSVTQPTWKGRVAISPFGLVAVVLTEEGTMLIEPTERYSNPNKHRVYWNRELAALRQEVSCKARGEKQSLNPLDDLEKSVNCLSLGTTLRKYRIAIAATGEFTNGVGGGTLAGTNALINERITALNVVYENEAAIHFDLIANNNSIIFFNAATDGLDPNDETTSANTVILNAIGANNFDIGHAFYEQPGSGGAGGVAGLGVVCNNARKAEGWSGATNDFSLGGFMGIFLHEVGHQFNADHSFYGTDNFCNQRSPGNGFEPGSGTTLMGYSICNSHNILPRAGTDYFHIHSLGQIHTYASNNTCQTNLNSGNTPPVVTIPGNFTIPKGTPFELTGSATDAQDGGLTYVWEEYDTDNLNLTFPSGNPNSAANSTTAPLFRSFDPSPSGNKRTFPQLSDIVNNTQTLGEILPQVGRTINMRLTVRDNHAGTTAQGTTAGGVTCESLSITVDANAGPFIVTSPNTNVTWAAGSAQTVTWNTANTAGFCGNVNILLSIDGGFTFPYVLATNTPNDGSQGITVPAGVVNTTQARVRVECNNANAKFFDISNVNFTITSTCLAASSRLCPLTGVVTTAGNPALNLGTKRFFGNQVLGSRVITFDAGDPTAPEASATSKGGTTCTAGGNSRYESVRFYVEQSGTYNLNTTFNGFVITSVYIADGFNINTPCANNKFVGSNAYNQGAGNQLFAPASLTLNACTEYIMVSYGSNSTETISLTGPGTIYVAAAAPSASYSYTFVAINQANGQVAAISPTANFSAPTQGTLTAGSYLVKGVSYLTTDGSTIAVGSTESAIVNSGKCLLFSTNAVPVTIQGAPSTCAITNITAGTQTACNPANNTYTQQVTVTYSNPPATGNLVVNGQNFAITTSPQTVTLTGLVSNGSPVNVTANFSAQPACTFTANTLFTAPQGCQTSPCTTYNNNTVVPIGAGPANTITSTITVPAGTGTISDVNITIVGTHTYVSDLLFTLQSPSGTIVTLIASQCTSEDNFNIKLDDQAANALTCPINAGNTQRPQNPLSVFNGQNPTGNWILTIADQAQDDGGQLTNWALEICRQTTGCSISNITAGTQTACNPATNTYTQQVTVTYTSAPNTGNLVVNGQSFAITTSPQTVTLTGLVSNGSPVNVTASFSALTTCALTKTALFTAPQSCQASACTNYTNNTAVPISAGPPSAITSVINVPQGGTITDVNITLVGTHTYVGDLLFSLRSPAGTTVNLIVSQCTSADNFNIKLDDQAANALTCPINAGSTQRPQNPLSVFNNQNSAGEWVLTISDQAEEDGGQLTSWILEICRANSSCNITGITGGTQTACNPANNTYTQQVTVTFTGAPATGNLVVNGQNFTIGTSPRTVTLTGLPSNGNPIDVIASFSASPNCTFASNNLFTAPTACQGTTCNTYNNTTAVPIPAANPNTITSTINVPAGGTITDVNITVVGTHTYVSDLVFTLQSPSGTIVTLIADQCTSEDNFNIKLDDQAANALACPINAGSTQRPQNPLSVFNTESVGGVWTLSIEDQFADDGGQLTSWILEICQEGGASNCNTPPPASGTIAAGTYQVSNTITTAGKIFSPSTVVFKAGTSITLTAGFEAKAGSTFTASIQPCASLNDENVETRTSEDIVAPVFAENELTIAPNPFSDQTTITYTLSETTAVTLTIYDLQGKRIIQPVADQTRAAGSYQVLFDAQNIPKGMYMVILQTATGTLSRKIVLTE